MYFCYKSRKTLSYRCQLQNNIVVEALHLDASAPQYSTQSLSETHDPLILRQILDGSTSGVLTYGSEIIVYAELLLYSAFQARIQKIIGT